MVEQRWAERLHLFHGDKVITGLCLSTVITDTNIEHILLYIVFKNKCKSSKSCWPLSQCCATILRGIGVPARTPLISRSPIHTLPYPGGFLRVSNICSCHVCTLHTFTIESRC